MHWLILLAAKSLLIAGGALILLKAMQKRSAADRSWIAHLAIAALVLLPLAAIALPTLDVAGPKFLVGKGEVHSLSSPLPSFTPATARPASTRAAAPAPAGSEGEVDGATFDWSFWGYAGPAALLLLLTLIALARLVLLKSRATVLVDAPWLTALARAQKRMGFKHGTALLTSNELPSPISWGVVRPVILLNAEAAQSHGEAEAIITHELAHVARLDWAKLLVSRVAVALFWFNPLVWLLAREAHQLREEAADDAVLATEIEGPEYASLLVGVARHECRGLLIGAHGVAPGRNSLSRRVKRVLDGAARRAPGGWRWGSAAAFFAAGMAVPVAALNLVPAAPAPSATLRPAIGLAPTADKAAAALAASATSAAAGPNASANPAATLPAASGAASGFASSNAPMILSSPDGSRIAIGSKGPTVLRSADGSMIVISPPDAEGRRKTVLRNGNGATIEYSDARSVPGLSAAVAGIPADVRASRSAVDQATAFRAVGADAAYIEAMRAAGPQLRSAPQSDFVSLRAVGVTPDYVRALAASGYGNLSAHDIVGAYASGLRPDYIRALAAEGYRGLSLDELTSLNALGVTAADVERFRRAGLHPSPEEFEQIKALGLTPQEVRAAASSP